MNRLSNGISLEDGTHQIASRFSANSWPVTINTTIPTVLTTFSKTSSWWVQPYRYGKCISVWVLAAEPTRAQSTRAIVLGQYHCHFRLMRMPDSSHRHSTAVITGNRKVNAGCSLVHSGRANSVTGQCMACGFPVSRFSAFRLG